MSAEQTMVDGILLLRERACGPRRERNIEVVKFRGSPTLRGNHAFQIGPRGITIHPRLEAAHRQSTGDAIKEQGLSTGVAALDAMWDIGGYARGSVTAVSGPSGSGKTTLALHYVAQASGQEKGLFFGFYGSPEMLARMAQVVGVAQRGGTQSHVEYLWHPFGENVLDALAGELLDRVRQSRAARVVIDSAGGFMAAPAFGERGGPSVERFKCIPVLLISGVPETALRSYEPAYDAFLRKPFGLDELLHTLQQLKAADR